jgi:hypothetical protein
MRKIETASEENLLRKQEIKEAVSATWQVDWTEFAVRPALRCIVGIAALLLLGLKLNNVGAGVMASSGALTAGFGAFYRFRWSRAAPMLLACLGISVSAFVSSITGHTIVGFTLVACFWAYGCGLLQTLGPGIWWVSLQCVIFALIASNFPVGLHESVTRTLLVLGGALLQSAVIMLFWRFDRQAERPASEPDDTVPFSIDAVKESARTFRSHLRANLSPATPIGRSALQLAVTVGLAAALSRLLPWGNGYWMPMTALIVVNTDWRQTFTKGLARIAGTLFGGGLATLLAVTLRPDPFTLVMLALTFAFLSYLFLRVNYAIYAIFITAYVVFQLATVGLPAAELVPARVLYTALGGVLALLLQIVWPVAVPDSREPLQEEARSV